MGYDGASLSAFESDLNCNTKFNQEETLSVRLGLIPVAHADIPVTVVNKGEMKWK